MAKTYTKQALRPIEPSNVYGSLVERKLPEGASQTFPPGSPLKLASGLAIVFVSASDGPIAAISTESGHNTASGSEIMCVIAHPNLEIEANFLGSAAADNVLAAADFGGDFDLATSTTLIGGADAGWYIQDSTSSVSVTMMNYRVNQLSPTSNVMLAEAGDTNARVRARILQDVLHFDT